MEHLNTSSNMFKPEYVAEALKEAERQRLEKLGEVAEPIEASTEVSTDTLATSLTKVIKKLLQTNQARGMLLALLGGSLANTLVLGLVDVIAISGFVGNVGTQKLPWLWIGELLLSLVISGVVLQIIDSIPRIKMMKGLLIGLSITYAILAGMFLLKIPTGFLYPLMYLIYAQQAIIFPMAFWNVANTVYSLAEARKLFPVLSSGELLGRLIGYSVFTLAGLLGYGEVSQNVIHNPAMIMGFSAVLFLIGQFTFSRIKDESRHQKPVKNTSFSGNIKNGLETIREVPFFRNMAALVAFTWIALTIFLFNFYTSIDEATAQGLQFQTIYSIYNITVLFLPLLFQWTFGDDLLKRISPQNGYLFLPFTLLIGMGLIFSLPGLIGGISAQFIAMVMYRGWYMPLYQSLYKLVPQERRGRVRSLLGNLSYTLGSLTGALLTGGIVLILPLLDIDTLQARTIYLLAALTATFVAIYIAFRIRATYETSLLSWRIARRARTSKPLEKLDDE